MDISKKELLRETKISYGQLYRWKREGLIPEAWFVKRSSPTGQETFFPKELILNRIYAIQQMKDRYSLEEMAKMLSPEVSNRTFSEEDLEEFDEIDIDVAAFFMDLLEKDNFTYYEILIMMVVSEWKKEFAIAEEALKEMIAPMTGAIPAIHDTSYGLLLLEIKEDYYMMILCESDEDQQKDSFFLDTRVKVLKHSHLNEMSNRMKVKYKDIFQFISDEEVSEDTYE